MRRWLVILSIVIIVTLGLGLSWKERRWTDQTMGTSYSVHVFLPGFLRSEQTPSESELKRMVTEQLLVISDSMSTYIPESEINQFNQLKPSAICRPVSDYLFDVLKVAQEIHSLSAGRFDVTVGPLVDLWGFGGKSIPVLDWAPPSQAAVEAQLDKVGFHKLMLGDHCVTKIEAVEIDVSAIAKGYGVDLIAKTLRAVGVEHFLVEIGGEIFAQGLKQPLRPWLAASPWQVSIEKPELGRTANFMPPLAIQDSALATSGDYRNFHVHNGRQYSHLINASTGQALSYDAATSAKLRSVTVVSDTTATADGLATALLLSGLEKARQMAIENDLNVLFIIESAKQDASQEPNIQTLKVWRSPQFVAFFKQDEA